MPNDALLPSISIATLLVVDDTPANLRVLSELLVGEGHAVRVATSAARALEAVQAEAPDLILLDVTMPGMDGFECCQALKADPATASIPVIFLTAHADTEHLVQGFAVGGVDYVTKPFREPELLARVRTHLELRRCQRLLETLASEDGLTGIANRRRFDLVLEQEWQRAMRCARPLSLVLADIDYFKRFNDGNGHAAGDVCLRRVARTFAAAFARSGDAAARFGGEEFAAILPDTGADVARLLALRARDAVFELDIAHGHSPVAACVSLSLGVATCIPAASLIPSMLIERADQALYAAKQAGRNRVETG